MRRSLFMIAAALCLPGRTEAQEPRPVSLDAGTGEQMDARAIEESVRVDVGHADSGCELEPASPQWAPPVQSSSADVVVSASRSLSRDRTQEATIIPGERLRETSRTTLFDVLSQEAADVYVPGHGIGLHGVGNGATGGIKIRGLGGSPNSQVLVVEDGVPDYQGIFGHPVPDAYASHLVEDVLVIKGGDSTLYGTNAMGGVVVIRNRWRDQEGYQLESDSGYGSYSTMRESVSVLGRWGGCDGALAFTGMKTDGHRDGAGGSDMVGSAAIRYRLTPNLRLTMRNKVVHVQGNDPGPVTNPTLDHWFDVWRDIASLQLAYTSRLLRLSLVTHLNAGVHRLYDGFHSRDYVTGAIGEIELRLHPLVRVTVGVAGEGIDGSVENRVTGERPEVHGLADASVYGQATFKPLPSLTVVAGARGLASDKYGFVPLYKAGARWDVGHGLYLHGHASRNFRQPTIRELHLPYPTANPDLRPEHSLNTDLGVGFFSGHVEIACTGYRTEARDLIKYFGSWPAAEVVNIDHLVILGVEGRVSVRRLGPVSASLSADWQDVGRYTRQNPDAKINFTVEAAQDIGSDFVGVSLTGEWVHGLYMADYDRQPIPTVFFMDLAVRYRRDRRVQGEQQARLEPYLILRNILDRQYAYVAGYTMPGFNVMAGLKIGI